jgi:hypothetical protein
MLASPSGSTRQNTRRQDSPSKHLALEAIKRIPSQGPRPPNPSTTNDKLQRRKQRGDGRNAGTQAHGPRWTIALPVPNHRMVDLTPFSASTRTAGWKSPANPKKRAHPTQSRQHERPCPRSSGSSQVRGRTFTGEYVMRFLQNTLPSLLPEETIACHYGALPQMVEHILLECST